jgi:hypothetical protein
MLKDVRPKEGDGVHYILIVMFYTANHMSFAQLGEYGSKSVCERSAASIKEQANKANSFYSDNDTKFTCQPTE